MDELAKDWSNFSERDKRAYTLKNKVKRLGEESLRRSQTDVTATPLTKITGIKKIVGLQLKGSLYIGDSDQAKDPQIFATY